MSIKLGFGSYEYNSPETPSGIRARIYFFRAIEQLEPQVLKNLHDKVFIYLLCFVYLTFQSRIEATKPLEAQTTSEALQNLRNNVSPEDVKNLIPEWQTLNEIKEATLIYENLIEWAKNWHLQEDWCLYYAFRVMRIWLFRETQRVPPSWSRADSGQWLDDSDMMIDALWDDLLFPTAINFYKSVYGDDLSKYGFFFDYAGVSFKGSNWNPFYDEVGEWKEKIRREFDEFLESLKKSGESVPRGIKRAFMCSTADHVAIVKAAALEHGFRVTPTKRDDAHFMWLVHYQVQMPNLSLEKIARNYNQELKTISDGIKRTAQLIGLTLRSPLPAGRTRRQV